MDVCVNVSARHTHASVLRCQILEAQTSNAVWLHSPGLLSAPLAELCWLHVEKSGNPCVPWLLSSLSHPFSPPLDFCVWAQLLLRKHSPCDNDKTASANSATTATHDLGKRHYDKWEHGSLSYIAEASCSRKKLYNLSWMLKYSCFCLFNTRTFTLRKPSRETCHYKTTSTSAVS